MGDAEKLRLYAQLAISKHQALDDSLVKAKARSKHWEREAKARAGKIVSAEKEKNEAKEEAQHTQLAAIAAGDAKALTEDKLATVQDALAVAGETRRKTEAEDGRLDVERTSLLLEIGAAKDEVSSLHSQVGKDKVAMKEDYQKALELIFAYDYKCCVFKHNICGDHPEVLDDMPDSSNPLPPQFFVNLRCLQASTATEATTAEVDKSKAAKEPERSASIEDQS